MVRDVGVGAEHPEHGFLVASDCLFCKQQITDS